MLIMEREEAQRALRLIRAGKRLTLTSRLDVEHGGPYESYNVVGEIRGRERPDEIVLVGAHLDSWGLGTGANDDGCNVALVVDLARQIKRLGLAPHRTIRFALFNGEEQGMNGSWGYTRTHAGELSRHVMASSYDIGSGRIMGFFTNGRADLLPLVDRTLEAVRGLGPFDQINAPIVGTDNFDFMLSGVPNLVANQESANYGPNYHARSDTFDKVDLRQLRLNAAIAAAVTWGFANMAERLPRQSRADVEKLIHTTDLGAQMKSMGVWKDWEAGRRGIK
jgi:Zn-dependent M28 family amino/carboxypeptidase